VVTVSPSTLIRSTIIRTSGQLALRLREKSADRGASTVGAAAERLDVNGALGEEIDQRVDAVRAVLHCLVEAIYGPVHPVESRRTVACGVTPRGAGAWQSSWSGSFTARVG
jgi:hypothetical protein